jgi:hypothetical protein
MIQLPAATNGPKSSKAHIAVRCGAASGRLQRSDVVTELERVRLSRRAPGSAPNQSTSSSVRQDYLSRSDVCEYHTHLGLDPTHAQ